MSSVCILGGGNIAHSLAAAITETQSVMVVTRRPGMWLPRITYKQAGAYGESRYTVESTSNPAAIADYDIIFIALPQFAVEEVLGRAEPYLKKGQTIAFVPAPSKADLYTQRLKAKGVDVVGFQRVPFISRIVEYGSVVSISEPREIHRIAVSDDSLKVQWQRYCKSWFQGKVEFLSSFLIFAFSNSNPLLHPARVVVLLRGGDGGCYSECPYFYAGWTDESSELYLKADEEARQVFHAYTTQQQFEDYEPVLRHYGVSSPVELTAKIRNIEGFRSILAPWQKIGEKWRPDFSSRYFTEDVPYGTNVIRSYAHQFGLHTPVIDQLAITCQRASSGAI